MPCQWERERDGKRKTERERPKTHHRISLASFSPSSFSSGLRLRECNNIKGLALRMYIVVPVTTWNRQRERWRKAQRDGASSFSSFFPCTQIGSYGGDRFRNGGRLTLLSLHFKRPPFPHPPHANHRQDRHAWPTLLQRRGVFCIRTRITPPQTELMRAEIEPRRRFIQLHSWLIVIKKALCNRS